MVQTRPFPTPTDVKTLPYSPTWLAAFALVPDDKVQSDFIANVAEWFGSAEVKQHTQRNEAVLYGAAHLLNLRLVDEGLLGGAGGAGMSGPVSSVKLEGTATMSFAVAAWTVADLNDWLARPSPFSLKLHGILCTFPPAMFVTGQCEIGSLAGYF